MATIKRIPDTYDVYVPTMTVHGNLNVVGVSTQIESTNTSIWDNIIALNAGTAGAPTLNAGIMVDRGTSPNVYVQWNETVKSWQITNNGTTYSNIAVVGSALSGNLNITGITLYDTANTVTVYTGTVSSGKSGIFVDNTNGIQQELATKSAAIAYSIIFG